MKRKRRQFSAEWKAKVALEAIKGQRTIQEIASHYEVHPNLVTHWKKQLLDGAAQVFSNGKTAEAEADEQVKAELYQQIGKLQVKVDWLKNSRDFHVSGATRMDRRTSRRPQYRQAMRADRDLQGRAVLQADGGERREPAVDAFAGRAVHPDAVLWGAPDEVLAQPARLWGEREARATTAAANGAGSDLSETPVITAWAGTSHLSLSSAGDAHRATRPSLGQR